MQSSVELPTLFLKNAEFMQTLHSLEFKSENAEFNLKIGSLFAESDGMPHCAFKKGRMEMNSLLSFPKMRSLLELPTLFLQNAEFTQTPPSAEFA